MGGFAVGDPCEAHTLLGAGEGLWVTGWGWGSCTVAGQI